MISPNTTGVYCPGCQAGAFPQPHICGAGGQTLASGYCAFCNTSWTGQHWCFRTTTEIVPALPVQAVPHDHCWCCEDGPGLRVVNGQYLRVDKPHEVCCGCGSRRVEVEQSP